MGFANPHHMYVHEVRALEASFGFCGFRSNLICHHTFAAFATDGKRCLTSPCRDRLAGPVSNEVSAVRLFDGPVVTMGDGQGT